MIVFKMGWMRSFAAYKFDYKFSYGELFDNSARQINFKYENLFRQMSFEESGESNLEFAEKETETSFSESIPAR